LIWKIFKKKWKIILRKKALYKYLVESNFKDEQQCSSFFFRFFRELEIGRGAYFLDQVNNKN